MTIAGSVVLTAGLTGFQPSRRPPLTGTQKFWEGVRFLSSAVIGINAKEEWHRENRKRDQNPELRVMN